MLSFFIASTEAQNAISRKNIAEKKFELQQSIQIPAGGLCPVNKWFTKKNTEVELGRDCLTQERRKEEQKHPSRNCKQAAGSALFRQQKRATLPLGHVFHLTSWKRWCVEVCQSPI